MKTTTVNTQDAIEMQGMRFLTDAELEEVSGGRSWWVKFRDRFTGAVKSVFAIKPINITFEF
ncbi:MAG: hypothetical protein WCI11_17580 [Candidatus Methylumidiphilus sp.]